MWDDYSDLISLLSEADGTGYVYRLLNQADEVIYVGQSRVLAARMHQHSRTQSWWPEVTAIHARPVPLPQLNEVERSEIRLWSPRYNTVHKLPARDRAPEAEFFNLRMPPLRQFPRRPLHVPAPYHEERDILSDAWEPAPVPDGLYDMPAVAVNWDALAATGLLDEEAS